MRTTAKGVIGKIYMTQKERQLKRFKCELDYTVHDLRSWLINDWLFNLLLDNWNNCGCITSMKPSLDRFKHKMPYALNNLKVMTWADNNFKGRYENRPKMAILHIDDDGNTIKEYESQLSAAKELGISQGSIGSCCSGRYSTAGGMKFKRK